VKHVETAPHEFSANLLYNGDELAPFFACNSRIKAGDGSVTGQFEDDGERWVARLSFQESNIVNPGMTTPQGTEFSIQTIHEYRLKVYRHPDEDSAGQRDFTAHLAPRWPGMQGEKNDGSTVDIPVPDGFGEGVNCKVQGSNIEFDRYPDLLAFGFDAVGVRARYFSTPHPSSNILDAERYVRLHRDESGPVHAREGPITALAHLLESDREGYRKMVQQDDDGHGRNLPGYYHTATLGPKRIREAWADHDLPKEVKHYYAREALSKPDDHPLAHPKLGASYQVSRWDETLAFDSLDTLNDELEETVLSVLKDSGIDIAPEGTGPYFPGAYFQPEIAENPRTIPSLDVTRIRSEQESVVVRHLADGFSPVQWESLETLVTDGGNVSPADIADENERHVGSVRRALGKMEDMVERQYSEVGLKSDYVAEMVRDAVQEAREKARAAVETSAQAIEAAERGTSQAMAEWVAWCNRYGIDISNRTDSLRLDLGDLDADADPAPGYLLREALSVWKHAGQDPARLRTAQVRYNDKQTVAFKLL
jgi:hypothetical protein